MCKTSIRIGCTKPARTVEIFITTVALIFDLVNEKCQENGKIIAYYEHKLVLMLVCDKRNSKQEQCRAKKRKAKYLFHIRIYYICYQTNHMRQYRLSTEWIVALSREQII